MIREIETEKFDKKCNEKLILNDLSLNEDHVTAQNCQKSQG